VVAIADLALIPATLAHPARNLWVPRISSVDFTQPVCTRG
jgi:hypothetical protein